MFIFVKIVLLFAAHISGTYIGKFVSMRSVPQSSTSSFSACTLQTSTVRSKLDCARRCFTLNSATGFTYTAPRPENASCVCLTSCVTSTNAMIATLQGKVLFMCGNDTASRLLWINKSCRKNADCPTQNSECYNVSSTCLCTPGYYYSNTCNTCVPQCDPRNLRSTFLKYTHACLAGHDDVTKENLSSDQCAAACSNNTSCLSFDYDFQNKKCFISYDTALTSHAFSPGCGGGPADHYQRMCF